MRIVTWCGSLHSGSTNAVVLATIAAHLEHRGATVEPIDTTVETPAFRPESVDRPPAHVAAVRDSFRRADGLVVSVPEYAGGMPGWVKNVLDWMVGAGALYERPAVVTSAATSGGTNALRQTAQTLTWQGAYVVATCSIPAPLTIVRDGELTDPDTVARLHEAADTLVDVLRGERSADRAMTEALSPFGLGPGDRAG